jgi:putative Holliday junction resolvase
MAAPGAVLAIDHGTRRTGFALADALRITSEPLTTFHGAGDGDELLDFIANLLADRQVSVIVVGQPLNMDGTAGPRAKDVAQFCERLSERFPNPELALVDERLSTKEADSRLVEAGHTGQDRKDRRDSLVSAERPSGDGPLHVQPHAEAGARMEIHAPLQ